MNAEDISSAQEGDQVRFVQLVSMFQVAAMQQLGKLVNPVTNEVERDLDQARASIDMLEMLKRRTEGNRSEAETALLDKVLFELHMNYVDEARAARNEGGEEGEPDQPDQGPATNADGGDETAADEDRDEK
jgi:hypothetical protein